MKITRMRSAALAVVAVGAAMLAPPDASAHGAPFTVTAGSAPAGTSVPVTLSSGQFGWYDTTTNVNILCQSVVLHGSITTGTTGARVGTIAAAQSVFTKCTGPAGLKYLVTGVGTWTLDVSDSSAGTSTVTVGNVRAHLVATAGPTCAWDFAAPTGAFTSSSTATADAGTLPATYANSTRALAVPRVKPGSLGLWNVRGGGGNTYCIAAAFFKQSDRISWTATWTVGADAAVNNPIAIN